MNQRTTLLIFFLLVIPVKAQELTFDFSTGYDRFHVDLFNGSQQNYNITINVESLQYGRLIFHYFVDSSGTDKYIDKNGTYNYLIEAEYARLSIQQTGEYIASANGTINIETSPVTGFLATHELIVIIPSLFLLTLLHRKRKQVSQSKINQD